MYDHACDIIALYLHSLYIHIRDVIFCNLIYEKVTISCEKLMHIQNMRSWCCTLPHVSAQFSFLFTDLERNMSNSFKLLDYTVCRFFGNVPVFNIPGHFLSRFLELKSVVFHLKICSQVTTSRRSWWTPKNTEDRKFGNSLMILQVHIYIYIQYFILFVLRMFSYIIGALVGPE